jgi:hypothetical protein
MRDKTITRIGCTLLALLPFGCCLVVSWPTVRSRETVLATKTVQGSRLQQLIVETTIRYSGPPLPGPHGPFSLSKTTYRYFIDEPGKPRRELSFLGDIEGLLHLELRWWSVDDSPLWVRTLPGYPLQSGNEARRSDWQISVVVFDETQAVYRRELKCFGEQKFRFLGGNRTIVYPTRQGFEAYDVTTDAITPWKPAKK